MLCDTHDIGWSCTGDPQINKELSGGDEVDELEAQRVDIQKRFKALSQQLEDATDPTFGMGVTPATGEAAVKSEEMTQEALKTDIASIEDEYGD